MLDSEKFNEWMNPVDYETEEAVAEQERLGLLIEGPTGGCPDADCVLCVAWEGVLGMLVITQSSRSLAITAMWCNT